MADNILQGVVHQLQEKTKSFINGVTQVKIVDAPVKQITNLNHEFVQPKQQELTCIIN